MNITSFSSEKIKQGITEGKKRKGMPAENVKLLFSPFEISDDNFEEVCAIYSRLDEDDYDTVVIVESHPGSAEKKLPMPSFKFVKTTLGEVPANDKLRNDFADEDDDFFVNDDAFDEDVSLFNQLMMLQCTLRDFSIQSIQITDETSFIVRELAFALEEILASKSSLVIFCCDLARDHRNELVKIQEFIDAESESGLMNYLNSGHSNVNGVGTLVAGLLLAKKWGLKIYFLAVSDDELNCKNLLSGFGVIQKQPISG